jgi:hypothetical protein
VLFEVFKVFSLGPIFGIINVGNDEEERFPKTRCRECRAGNSLIAGKNREWPFGSDRLLFTIDPTLSKWTGEIVKI